MPKSTALQAVYTSVGETPQLTPLSVIGELPKYIAGNLFRNGPGTFEVAHTDGEVTSFKHWFDGISMLHRFKIDGATGTVAYMSRTTAPAMVRAAASVPKRKYNPGITFGVMDPCKGIFGKAMSMFTSATKDPKGERLANIGVTVEVVPGKGLLSRSDMPTGYRIDAESLEVAEFESWSALEVVGADGTTGRSGGLAGNMSAAHGEFDEETGEYFNFTYQFGKEPVTYKVFRVGADGRAEVLAQIPYRATYCHSIALTKKYVVLVLYPEFVNGPTVLFEKSLMGAMSFDASVGTKFFVISREEKRLVATYSAPSFWAFHVVNSFDGDAGEVCIDLCSYKDGNIINELYVENLRTKEPSFFSDATIRRYTLLGLEEAIAAPEPPTGMTVSEREVCHSSVELVRINQAAHLKDYQYAYGPGPGFKDAVDATSAVYPMSKLLKIDVKSGQSLEWSAADHHCSEAIFVPDPASNSEDAGSLLSVCHDGATGKSFLLVLDAKNMTEVARAYSPMHVPAGFHGGFAEF